MDREPDIASQREAAWLATFAMHGADSAGRRHPELPHPYRGHYQRDRDRILHSAAFRRLSHKTQVFMGEMGDYHRTRLTHTLEVASIARTIARALRLNEDLVEALALAHDIGHPPFGHSGEEVLDHCLSEWGGFNHNAQALRIFELLEARYPEFPGLNLTREVLEGQAYRASKWAGSRKALAGGRADDEGGDWLFDSRDSTLSPLLEVQVVDAADSIAYDAHDADDSLEIGLLDLGELLQVPLWREAAERVSRRFVNLTDQQLRRAIVHELIDWRVSDIVRVVEKVVTEQHIDNIESVRRSEIVVRPSSELAGMMAGLEGFLVEHVYRHATVLARRREAELALRQLFESLLHDPGQLPSKFGRLAEQDGVPRAVGDYIAGMTDRYALEERRRLIVSR